jgi:hypothetical protein
MANAIPEEYGEDLRDIALNELTTIFEDIAP